MEKEPVERDVKTIQEILCQLLSRESMDEDEDIYIAGVTSIMALPLLVQVEDAFKLTIPDSQFLGARTVRALAELVGQLRTTSQRCT